MQSNAQYSAVINNQCCHLKRVIVDPKPIRPRTSWKLIIV